MPRSRQLFAGFFSLSIALLAASAQAGEPVPPRGELKVTNVEGAASVTAKGGAAQPLAARSILHEGDLVETGPDGRVEILLATGTQLRIGPSAKAELREAPPAGGRFKLKLAVGNLWAHVSKLLGADKFEIETQNGVAGVRGTEFTVDAASNDADDLLRVYEGAVQCDHIAGKWSKRLEPGKELLFHRDRPTTLRAFDVAAGPNLRDWKPAAKKDGAEGDPADKGGDRGDKKGDRRDNRREERKEDRKEKKEVKEKVKASLKKD